LCETGFSNYAATKRNTRTAYARRRTQEFDFPLSYIRTLLRVLTRFQSQIEIGSTATKITQFYTVQVTINIHRSGRSILLGQDSELRKGKVVPVLN
jgi:hypothetical protein